MNRHCLVGCFWAFLVALPLGAQAVEHAHHGVPHAGTLTASARAYDHAMEKMHRAMRVPRSGNPDVDFVRQMIPHHQAAIDMAKVELAYGDNESLKRFARWVITAQEQEIGAMQQWLRRRDNGAASPSAPDHYGAAMEKMHRAMMAAPHGDADDDFARGMIPHHQGAVDMADILFARGNDPEVHALADGIHRAQTYEIAWLEHWLKRRGNASFPSINP